MSWTRDGLVRCGEIKKKKSMMTKLIVGRQLPDFTAEKRKVCCRLPLALVSAYKYTCLPVKQGEKVYGLDVWCVGSGIAHRFNEDPMKSHCDARENIETHSHYLTCYNTIPC